MLDEIEAAMRSEDPTLSARLGKLTTAPWAVPLRHELLVGCLLFFAGAVAMVVLVSTSVQLASIGIAAMLLGALLASRPLVRRITNRVRSYRPER